MMFTKSAIVAVATLIGAANATSFWVNSGCVNANVGEGRSWVQVCNRDDQTWTVDSASITVEACLNQDTHCWVSAAVPGNYAHVNWGEDNCLYSEGPNPVKLGCA